MKDVLVVIDMQKDFIDGALGSAEAQLIVDDVNNRIRQYQENGREIIYTADTHEFDYLNSREGKALPVEHCIKGSEGHEIAVDVFGKVFEKNTFGSVALGEYVKDNCQGKSFEIIGVCTDICVISNAVIIRSFLPESEIVVNSQLCAGVSPQTHANAIAAMEMLQVQDCQED